MAFTDLFIRRPVLASVVSLLILLLGIRAITALELRQYPETENTVITISTSYPGASSELIKGFITTPLQQAIAEADGIDYLSSNSSQGVSTIEAHMRLNYDSNAAVAEIQAKVASQRNVLPAAAEDPVITAQVGESDGVADGVAAWVDAQGDPAYGAGPHIDSAVSIASDDPLPFISQRVGPAAPHAVKTVSNQGSGIIVEGRQVQDIGLGRAFASLRDLVRCHIGKQCDFRIDQACLVPGQPVVDAAGEGRFVQLSPDRFSKWPLSSFCRSPCPTCD